MLSPPARSRRSAFSAAQNVWASAPTLRRPAFILPSHGCTEQDSPLSTRAVNKPYAEPHLDPDYAASAPAVAASAVSWGAILAGATAAAALSLVLLLLGTGLGLSSVSPWSNNGATATTIGVGTILWLALTQLLASGMGGYLSGRLRTRWVASHQDEVYFRDTAHGFLAWGVASLAMAALLTSAVGSIVGGTVQAGASLAGGVTTAGVAASSQAAKPDGEGGPLDYFVDSLFRPHMRKAASGSGGSPAAALLNGGPERAPRAATSLEITRIFANSIRTGNLPADDLRYVGQEVATRTGLTQAEAERRVSETYARWQAALHDAEAAAKDAADKARKASAYAALWMVMALLSGAFLASLAATYGGRQRDA